MGVLERLQLGVLGAVRFEPDAALEGAVVDFVGLDRQGRADIIARQYDEVTLGEAEEIAGILMDHKLDNHGFRSPAKIVDEVNASMDHLNTPLVEELVRTEIASIRILGSLQGYTSQDRSHEFRYKLLKRTTHAAHPVLATALDELDRRGGAVSLARLQDLLRDAATRHESEGGTPERMDHWVAYRCPEYAVVRDLDT